MSILRHTARHLHSLSQSSRPSISQVMSDKASGGTIALHLGGSIPPESKRWWIVYASPEMAFLPIELQARISETTTRRILPSLSRSMISEPYRKTPDHSMHRHQCPRHEGDVGISDTLQARRTFGATSQPIDGGGCDTRRSVVPSFVSRRRSALVRLWLSAEWMRRARRAGCGGRPGESCSGSRRRN